MGYFIAFVAGVLVGMIGFAVITLIAEEDNESEYEPWFDEEDI